MTNEAPLRADARKNRERILAAAEQVFLELGAGASLEDVAKRAGVGIGTLYRRFPTRESLWAATSSARFLSFAETTRARTESEPGRALRAYLEELVEHTKIYRGLATSLGTVLQSGTPGCHATSRLGMDLLSNAQKAGVARRDVSFDDLLCFVTAISLVAEREGSAKSRIAHLVSLFLDGIFVRRKT